MLRDLNILSKNDNVGFGKIVMQELLFLICATSVVPPTVRRQFSPIALDKPASVIFRTRMARQLFGCLWRWTWWRLAMACGVPTGGRVRFETTRSQRGTDELAWHNRQIKFGSSAADANEYLV